MFHVFSLVCFLIYGVKRRQVLIAKPHLYFFNRFHIFYILISNFMIFIRTNWFLSKNHLDSKNWFWISKTDSVVFWISKTGFCCLFQKLILLSFQKRGVFFGGVRPHLETLRHDGHVHVLTFGSISFVPGPKLHFWRNF